jgi:hypothetical protein
MPESGKGSDQLLSLSDEDLLQDLELHFRQSGLCPSKKFHQWATFRLDVLRDFTIQSDWQRLEEMGVTRECLAVAMMLINLAPGIDPLLKQYSRNKRQRQAKAEMLLSPIPVLEEIAQVRKGMYEESAREEIEKAHDYPTPDSIINGLRLTADLLLMGDKLLDAIEANSMLEIAKYGLAGVVRRVTARYHDREVSALTGAALQKPDYDETAHRVWRIRNYPRLEHGIPRIVPVALHAINTVLLHAEEK